MITLRAVLAVLSVCLLAAACSGAPASDAEEAVASPAPVVTEGDTGTDEGAAADEPTAADGAAAAAGAEGADALRTRICDLTTCTDELVLSECIDIEEEGELRMDQCPKVYAANTDDGLVLQLVVIDLDELVETGWAVTLEGAAEGLYLDCTYGSASDSNTCASYDFAETVDLEAGTMLGSVVRTGNRAAMVVEFPGLRLDAAGDALVLRDASSSAERTFTGCTVRYGAGPSARDFVLRGAATCHEAVG